jgi:hypothetical protein
MAPATDAALLRTAVVCASNMNRSMEAHRVFRLAGMDVRLRRTCSLTKKQPTGPSPHSLRSEQVSSFGVGQHVKLPGCVCALPVSALV